MELVLCLVSLSAILLFLPGVYLNTFYIKNTDTACGRPIKISCLTSTKRFSKEIVEAQRLGVPKSRAAKCLYNCMLNSARLISIL